MDIDLTVDVPRCLLQVQEFPGVLGPEVDVVGTPAPLELPLHGREVTRSSQVPA